MNISVNGVWAGFGGGHYILPFPPFVHRVAEEFGEDVGAFVSASKAAGLVVVCGINGIEGMALLREGIPNWETMSCRDAAGELVLWGNPEEQCYIMCTNDPAWVAWEIDYGKQGIDAGAEFILIDTPQGQAIANTLRRAGFCDDCMGTFEAYLDAKYTDQELLDQFGIAEFDAAAIVDRLKVPDGAEGESLTWINRTASNPLFREFILCQEEASFRTRKALVDALRAHAAATGKKIAISANTFNLSAVNPFGYWIRAIMFGDMLDLFAYEQSHCPAGLPFQETKMPRGKWSAYHKLAYAVTGARNPTVVGAGALGQVYFPELGQGRTHNAWLGVQSAEAYASGGAYIMYYFDAPANAKEVMWAETIKNAGFVHAHAELFEGRLTSGSPLALLFLFNERGRAIPAVFPSYLGLAQGLIELNVPFDVVFGGDGHYVQDTLASGDLAAYSQIVVPSPIQPTSNQVAVVRSFVEGGGTVVTQEPELLGFTGDWAPSDVPNIEGTLPVGEGQVWRLAGEVTVTATNDAGERFFRDYEGGARDEIGALAAALDVESILPDAQDGLVCGFAQAQEGASRVVVHLVNYDVDYAADTVRPASDVRVRVPRPAFLTSAVEARYVADHLDEAATLDVANAGDAMEVVVPRLERYGSVVFEAEAPALATIPQVVFYR